jgi:hypothetical protein
MEPRAFKAALSVPTKKTIFSVGCILVLFSSPLVASAQGAAEPAADPATSGDQTEDSDVAPGDQNAEEAEGASEASESDVPEETAEEPPAVEDVPPPSDDAVEPLDDGASSTSDDQPDYFGGLEPASPAYQVQEPSPPEKPGYTGPFRAGALRLGLGIGGGGYGDQTYLILGFGVGYFLVNGLELHVDTDFWLIGEPFIATPSPGLRYVMWFVPKVHPYVGGFYRHYFSGSGYPDANSIGARGGVYLMTGRSSYFGLGGAYEHMLDDELFVDTDFIYPEIAFAFAF